MDRAGSAVLSDVSIRRVEGLFDLHHRRLYALARRMSASADDARDLVQETYLRAAQAVASIPDDRGREEAWLVRVLVNLCRDGWRRGAVRRRLDPMHAAETIRSAAPDHERAYVARTTVWDALETLPPRRRAILILYELEDTGIREIATLLGVSPVTVRWHLSVGRRELARTIQGLPAVAPGAKAGQDRQACPPKRDARRGEGQDAE